MGVSGHNGFDLSPNSLSQNGLMRSDRGLSVRKARGDATHHGIQPTMHCEPRRQER